MEMRTEEELFQDWTTELHPYYDNDPDIETKLFKYYNAMLEIVNKAGYSIKNKKAFKNELASMIYRLTHAKKKY
jgi:hypothetical protein